MGHLAKMGPPWLRVTFAFPKFPAPHRGTGAPCPTAALLGRSQAVPLHPIAVTEWLMLTLPPCSGHSGEVLHSITVSPSGTLPQARPKTFFIVVWGWQCPLKKPLLGLFSFCLCFPIQEKASVTTAADSFSDLVPSAPDITFVCCQSGKNNDLPAHFSSADYVGGEGEEKGALIKIR